MNLLKFLKQVDMESNAMSKTDLTKFVHDMARILSESEREDFLRRLRMQKEGGARADGTDERQEITRKLGNVKAQLQRIEDGELCLVGSFNEEYDEWYCSEEEEFLYEDPEGVLETIEDACRFVHQCIDCEAYKPGYEIAELLIGLEIEIDGDYREYTDEPMPIDELDYYHLGNLNYKSLVVDALCAGYCAHPLSERPDVLYRILTNSRQDNITLEAVMQRGGELPEIDDFISLWISYLGQITTETSQKLLKEALELCNNAGQILENARKYHTQHPELYEQYILNQMEKGDDSGLFEVGREALERIDVKYTVRSRIALLMCRLAFGSDMDAVEMCWLEAFRSDSRVVNYLRLLTECRDLSGIGQDAAHICHKIYKQSWKDTFRYVQGKPEEINQVNPVTVYMLAFLTGEFQYVREHGMNYKDSLGWSGTFMKCGLAAFLLFLTKGDALMAGTKAMCHMVVSATGFDKEDYEKGIPDTIEESSEEWFWKCFCRWKESVVVSGEERENYLQWTEELITKRVIGIMDKNHRNYYGECAAYIAALGEALESGGEKNGKQNTMLRYKEMYSRRSAFHGELRTFGMIENKRKSPYTPESCSHGMRS